MNTNDPIVIIVFIAIGVAITIGVMKLWPRLTTNLPAQPPVILPPLVPNTPTLPSTPVIISPPPQLASSINPVTILLIVVLGVMFFFPMRKPSPGPGPEPIPDTILDLYSPFAQGPNRVKAASDAATFGRLCGKIAEGVEFDGQLPDPRLTKGVSLDILRRDYVFSLFRGRQLRLDYPLLPTVVGAYLDKTIGKSFGGPLTADNRAKFIAAYKELERAAIYAAKKL